VFEQTKLKQFAYNYFKYTAINEAMGDMSTIFEDIFEHARNCIVICRAIDDGEDFKIVMVNKAVEKVEQIPRSEIIGKRVTDVFPGVGEFGLLDVFRRVYQTGIPEHHPASLYHDQRISGWRDSYVYKISPDWIVTIYDDVTDLVERQEEIKYLNSLLLAIRNINQTIAMEPDTDKMLKRICRELVEKDCYSGCWIKTLNTLYMSGFQDEAKFRDYLRDNTPRCIRNLGHNEIRIIECSENCRDCPLGDEEEKTALVGSLGYLDQDYGVMLVTVPTNRVKEAEMSLFKEVVGDIGFALYSHVGRRKLDDAERAKARYIKQLEALHRYSRQLKRLYSVSDIASLVIDVVKDVIEFTHCNFIVVEGDMFVVKHQKGLGSETYRQSVEQRSIVRRAYLSKQTQLVPNTREDPDFYIGPAEGVYTPLSELCVPIIVDGEVVALLNLEDEELDAFDEYDKRLVETLAVQVASQLSTIDYLNELQRSEFRFSLILEEAIDGVAVIVGRKVVYVNPALCRMLGYSEKELLQVDILDLHTPTYRDEIREYIKATQRGDTEPLRYSVQLTRKDDSIIDVEYQVSHIDWMGKKAILTYVRDITDRLRFERTLYALHEASLQLNAATSIDMVIDLSLDIVESVLNHHYLGFLVVEEDALKFKATRRVPLLDVALPLNGPGISVRAAREKKTQLVNDVSLDPDYIPGYADTSSELATPIIIDNVTWGVLNIESPIRGAFSEDDRVLLETLCSSISSTIIRIKNQEALMQETQKYLKELELRETRYRTLINTTRDLIVEHDLQGYIIYANKAAVDFFGYEPSETKNIRDFIPQEYIERRGKI